MEQEAEEIQSNNLVGELKKKDLDPPLKRESFNMLQAPVMYTSIRNNWTENSPNVFVDNVEAKDLSKFVASFPESGLPCTSTPSMKDPNIMVEELTAGSFFKKNSNTLRMGQWHHLYDLASKSRNKDFQKSLVSKDKDQLMVSAREEMMRMPSAMDNIKRLSRKQIDSGPEEISAYSKDIHDKIMSSNRQPIQGTELKTLSTSNFSRFFVKNTLNGENFGNPETFCGFGGSVTGQNDEKLSCVIKEASDALLKSSAKNGEHSLRRIDRSGQESYYNGISLREWLKPRSQKVDKAKSLNLFRQILELVDFAHSQGVALQDFRPSFFTILPSSRIKYTGSSAKREPESFVYRDMDKKRIPELDASSYNKSGAKMQKISDDIRSFSHEPHVASECGFGNKTVEKIDSYITGPHQTYIAARQESVSVLGQLEKKWYTSPQEPNERCNTFSSNIYGLGVLLFELLCGSESQDGHSAAMLNLRHRILPPNFLSENPKEAGFCIWLLHPEPSSRPTTREILQSELMCGSQGMYSRDNFSVSSEEDKAESELLLLFLSSLKVQKQKHASKLVEDIGCLEEDVKEIERMHLLNISSIFSSTSKKSANARELGSYVEDPTRSGVISRSFSQSSMDGSRLMSNLSNIENIYFSMRSQIKLMETAAEIRADKSLLKNREMWSQVQHKNEEPSINKKSTNRLGAFFEGLCKFARYSKFEVCGTSRSADLLKSANVICSLSFDRDEDHIAAAGISKKIKIFEFSSLLSDSVGIHYPVVEMTNKSNLSSVCWNNYIKNYLVSTDYDGVVQMWDANTGQGFCQYKEHQKRAWAVDFSHADPTKLASGSDDCSVKLWSINERNSIGSIRNPANVCCVQFSAFSSNLLVLGSADYKTYCYDLRNTRIPWCTLNGHAKTVSYVKFLDPETLVSASTDNTIRLWDLNKTSPVGLSSNACDLTFTGHSNEKNFVGLSVFDGYIVCGSETNEVYSYYRSLPMPITSHTFGSIDPITGHEIADDTGKFVSSVCWRKKSNMVVAANSTGNMKVLQMV